MGVVMFYGFINLERGKECDAQVYKWHQNIQGHKKTKLNVINWKGLLKIEWMCNKMAILI